MSIFDIFKDFEPDYYFLKEVKPLVAHIPEAKVYLEHLYDNKHMSIKHRLATILNSIFSQNLQTFMFSKRTLEDLFEKDEASKYKALGTNDYKELLAILTNSQLFTVLRQPTRNKAGVYKLIEPSLVKILVISVGQQFLEAQESKILEFYDGVAKIEAKPVKTQQEHKESIIRKVKADLEKLNG